jgi:hypothetical protein
MRPFPGFQPLVLFQFEGPKAVQFAALEAALGTLSYLFLKIRDC